MLLGNSAILEAFTTILDKVDEAEIHRILCLGDVAGYGANPNECTEILRVREATVLSGNHDAVACGREGPSANNGLPNPARDMRPGGRVTGPP